MAIPDEQKEEIRARIDLADLISSYGCEVKHNGSGLWCRCPFHTEKTPSFKIDPAIGRYHCFGCGESGDAFDFVMKQEGLSFGEAVKKLAERVGMEIKKVVDPATVLRGRLLSLMADLAIDFNKMLKAKSFTEAETARKYLQERQLGEEAIKKFLIGYVPKEVGKILAWAAKKGYTEKELVAAGILKARNSPSDKPYSYFGGRLVFSIRDKYGKVVAFSGRKLDEQQIGGKYVNSPETLLFKKAKTMFGFDEARKNIVKAPNREALICEGQIDCIRLHLNGFRTAVAPLGTAFTEEHAVMLHRVADSALLCFDDDAAGHKATIKAASILLAEGMPIRTISLPDGDDPDSYILKHGKEEFERLVNSKAETIVKFQIRAEQAKEKDTSDPNAIVRITKAILSTISNCKSRVMLEALLKEASKLLDIQYAVLAEEIKKSVKIVEEKQEEDADKLIDLPVAGNAGDGTNLPNPTEEMFIRFLMENEGGLKSERKDIKDSFPQEVLKSPLTVKFLKAWLEDSDGDRDSIREVIEGVTTEEYKAFISLMTFIDPMSFFDVPENLKLLYFIRQIWCEYCTRILERLKLVPQSQDRDELVVFARNSLYKLLVGTTKEVCRIIKRFPYKKFADIWKPLDAVPKSQKEGEAA